MQKNPSLVKNLALTFEPENLSPIDVRYKNVSSSNPEGLLKC